MSYHIHWFRRDLRLFDNRAIFEAQKSGKVRCLFIFDEEILSQLPKRDRRVTFIYDRVTNLKKELRKHGSDLIVRRGKPVEIIYDIISSESIDAVYTNEDYEPYAAERDGKVKDLLESRNIRFVKTKDQVIFEKNEIVTANETQYTVYTPYKKRWLLELTGEDIKEQKVDLKKFCNFKDKEMLDLGELGFERVEYSGYPIEFKGEIPANYEEVRDLPSVDGTSRLSCALRFGTTSIRELVRYSLNRNKIYLSELIWREFFMQILWAYPWVAEEPFRGKYSRVKWRNNKDDFKRWCNGVTGYPLVDAGMRELNETGYMHNRVRMVVASFLVKHLLIDWRWGERYFAEKLMDFELASNNGNWQWAAGCGTDAAPYFRIFNPESQQKKFDKEFQYIMKWVKEYGTPDYPNRIVEHKFARERCLEAFRVIKG